ncbi:MAG TPA: hypothetical protein P5528_10580, partial [Steroidobacteraceae bacterium]|nr:hypothetical protein [Steroidobacteraceae bacterium]
MTALPQMVEYRPLSPGLIVAVLLGCAIVALYFVVPAAIELPRDVVRNYNEGWGAVHADRFLAGLPLYPPADALIVNNYPPLWYVLLAAARILGFDPVIFGRACALVSQFASTVLVGIITWRLVQDRLLAAVAAMLFLAGTTAWLPSYVAMNDPQWLSCTLMLAGLAVLVSSPQSSSAVAAAILIVVGGFVKHSGLAIPLTAAVYLYLTDRRLAQTFVLTVVIASMLGFIFSLLAFGGDFLRGLFLHAREWDLRLTYWLVSRRPLFFAFGVVVFCLALARLPSGAGRRLSIAFLGISFTIGSLLTTGAGVSENVFFEAWAAIAIAFALLLAGD